MLPCSSGGAPTSSTDIAAAITALLEESTAPLFLSMVQTCSNAEVLGLVEQSLANIAFSATTRSEVRDRALELLPVISGATRALPVELLSGFSVAMCPLPVAA